jgi:hypothetical protein
MNLIKHIVTVNSSDREPSSITDVSIIRENELWRLIISRRTEVGDPIFERTEILLTGDYFEKFTSGDFRFLLSDFRVPGIISDGKLMEVLPMLREGEQSVPETYHDGFMDRNRDKWKFFGITDVIERRNNIAEAMFRIGEMERILDNLNCLMLTVKNTEPSEAEINAFFNFLPEVEKLGKYYAGSDWKNDFALDEAGEFPSYLKRGVLSEDGVYTALECYYELIEELG